MRVYYNENDANAVQWLLTLMTEGVIPDGDVDDRSITDVSADDLADYDQCHFFAGIGGWAYALQLAGWDYVSGVWTGSCPCQPWSIANVWEGGGKGTEDERDLWPRWFDLIEKRKPAIVFGEQVPNAIKKGWLDRAFSDLETQDYTCAAAVLRADAYKAEHQRKRLYFVADAGCTRREGHQSLQRVSVPAAKAQPIDGDPLTRARRALAGHYSDLLPCDGLSVTLERSALRGYGNAIVPQVAAEFVQAFGEARSCC